MLNNYCVFGKITLEMYDLTLRTIQKYIRWLKNNHPAEWSSIASREFKRKERKVKGSERRVVRN